MSALIREPEPKPAPEAKPTVAPTGARELDIDLIDPNPYQPRTSFREEPLEELAQSIRSTGVIQPIVVRPLGTRFQLIAGERRWRAAQRAGLLRIPVVVRDVPESLALEMTLVENLQREDLNPVEQGRAFERLLTAFHLTQEVASQRTGKDRATIANAVRLLKLEEPILALLESGRLSAGHGRALLSIADPKARMAAAVRAADGKLSVRQLERMANRQPGHARKAEHSVDPNTTAALEELQRALGTRVTLRAKTRRAPGELRIEYYDDQQLFALYDRLMGRKDY
ncbi:MAG TPA: ParB/RepB/Spo0J family partition protein [Burkholderiales bacterium]